MVTIDYTRMRKATRSALCRILYCPKCGRKGKYVAAGKFANGEIRRAYYLHKETLNEGISSMDDFCTV